MAKKPESKSPHRTALTQNLAGKSYEELVRQAQQSGTKVKETPIVDKEELIGVPFVITDVAVKEGDFGPWVQCSFLTQDGEVGKFSDGSTGVCAQLDPSQNGGEELRLPIHVPGGLRKSSYMWPKKGSAEFKANGGKQAPATTYYLTARAPLKALGSEAGTARRAG